MLIEFNVANYRSFRDEVTFSMVASPLKAEGGEPDVRNQFAAPGDISLLTSAAIYGANASGKSNLIAAFDFMQRFVSGSLENTERTGGIGVEPFRLSTETDTKPSFFEVVFIADDQHYRYGFEVTAQRVVAEWLHVVPTNLEPDLSKHEDDEIMLFERDLDDVVLGEKFEAEGRDLATRTRPNALFLSVGAQFNGETAQKVLGWFRTVGVVTGLGHLNVGMRKFTERMLKDMDSFREIADLVVQSDLGITGILISGQSPTSVQLPDGAIEEFLAGKEIFPEFPNSEERVEVRTAHSKIGDAGQSVAREFFDLDVHESEGTRKLFAMSGPLVDTLKRGEILIIDELDARLHPLLSKEIVRLFCDPQRNPNYAQLVFTTHDTNLLDHQLMRRDQIWFTEKDHQGASHLYSLVEFKIDNDALFERDYIQGRYGAIPFLGNIRQVFLEDE